MVVGVNDSNMWFHCDGDVGASFWQALKTPADFARRGFKLKETAVGSFAALSGFEAVETDETIDVYLLFVPSFVPLT